MEKNRIFPLFRQAQDFASAIIPFPSQKAKFCADADAYQASEPRVFAHTGHRKGVICWAKAGEKELSDREILGISLHEFGHVIAEQIGKLPGHTMEVVGEKTPKQTQDEADEIVRQILRVPLYYNQRTLQEVSPNFITK